MSRASKEGAHPAAADGRWSPAEPTRKELRAALFHPHYGSQVRHLLPSEVAVAEVNTIGESERKVFPTLDVKEERELQRSRIVSGD